MKLSDVDNRTKDQFFPSVETHNDVPEYLCSTDN